MKAIRRVQDAPSGAFCVFYGSEYQKQAYTLRLLPSKRMLGMICVIAVRYPDMPYAVPENICRMVRPQVSRINPQKAKMKTTLSSAELHYT